MDKEANLFLYELYQRMPADSNDPYLGLTVDEFYGKYKFLFEFYEDNYPLLLPADKKIKILDVGFGYGMFMAYLKKKGYSDIHGVEYNKAQVDNALKMDFYAEWISDIAGYLENNKGKFNLIHASNIVEHFPKYDLLNIFAGLRGALKPGGVLIVVVPNIAG